MQYIERENTAYWYMVMKNAALTAKDKPVKESTCKGNKYYILLSRFHWRSNSECEMKSIAKLMNHIVQQRYINYWESKLNINKIKKEVTAISLFLSFFLVMWHPVVTINLLLQYFLLTVCPVYILNQHKDKAFVIHFQE